MTSAIVFLALSKLSPITDDFENFIDYRDKNIVPIIGNPNNDTKQCYIQY